MPTLLIDNTSDELHAPDWVTIPTGQGTLGSSVSRANNTKDLTSFHFSFSGSSFEIHIIVSPFVPHNLPSDVTISLDQEEWISSAVSSLGDARYPYQTSHILFSAPVVDGYHSISVIDFPPQYSLDYIIVFRNFENFWDTDLIIEDDGGNAIQYTGEWDHNPAYADSVFPLPSSQEYISFEPYFGTIHRVKSGILSVKTSATYHFIGTSVFVYGILESPPGGGNMTIAFTFDGSEMKRTYYPGSVPQPNFLWFGRADLPLTSHTLQIDVLELTGMDFVLDYIISKPDASVLPKHNVSSQLNPPFSSGGNIPEKPDWSLPNSATAETWGYTKGNQVSQSTIIGASIGGIVGALLVIVIALLFWLRYRTRRKKGRVSKDNNRDGGLPFAIH